jgi:hypothetical protein
MKGTELTDAQLDAAETFILERETRPCAKRDPSTLVEVEWKNLVRLVAWYGAIRFSSALSGGSSTSPGPMSEVAR